MTAPTSSTSVGSHWSSPLPAPARHAERAHLRRLIADADDRLLLGDIERMNDVVVALNDLRASVPRSEWLSIIAEVIAPHPMRARLHEEPFTRRAFLKPRGYPGDAPLLDLI